MNKAILRQQTRFSEYWSLRRMFKSEPLLSLWTGNPRGRIRHRVVPLSAFRVCPFLCGTGQPTTASLLEKWQYSTTNDRDAEPTTGYEVGPCDTSGAEAEWPSECVGQQTLKQLGHFMHDYATLAPHPLCRVCLPLLLMLRRQRY